MQTVPYDRFNEVVQQRNQATQQAYLAQQHIQQLVGQLQQAQQQRPAPPAINVPTAFGPPQFGQPPAPLGVDPADLPLVNATTAAVMQALAPMLHPLQAIPQLLGFTEQQMQAQAAERGRQALAQLTQQFPILGDQHLGPAAQREVSELAAQQPWRHVTEIAAEVSQRWDGIRAAIAQGAVTTARGQAPAPGQGAAVPQGGNGVTPPVARPNSVEEAARLHRASMQQRPMVPAA